MKVGNRHFKKRQSHLVTCESGPSETKVDYCFVKRDQRKFVKSIKVLTCKKCT